MPLAEDEVPEDGKGSQLDDFMLHENFHRAPPAGVVVEVRGGAAGRGGIADFVRTPPHPPQPRLSRLDLHALVPNEEAGSERLGGRHHRNLPIGPGNVLHPPHKRSEGSFAGLADGEGEGCEVVLIEHAERRFCRVVQQPLDGSCVAMQHCHVQSSVAPAVSVVEEGRVQDHPIVIHLAHLPRYLVTAGMCFGVVREPVRQVFHKLLRLSLFSLVLEFLVSVLLEKLKGSPGDHAADLETRNATGKGEREFSVVTRSSKRVPLTVVVENDSRSVYIKYLDALRLEEDARRSALQLCPVVKEPGNALLEFLHDGDVQDAFPCEQASVLARCFLKAARRLQSLIFKPLELFLDELPYSRVLLLVCLLALFPIKPEAKVIVILLVQERRPFWLFLFVHQPHRLYHVLPERVLSEEERKVNREFPYRPPVRFPFLTYALAQNFLLHVSQLLELDCSAQHLHLGVRLEVDKRNPFLLPLEILLV
eukprot:746179-Hanusia_phi.AAC.3